MDTPASLLERLRQPAPESARTRFVQLYTPLLFFWARRLGLRDADAADLVQDVLTLLVRNLPEFSYDRNRSFRAWLRTVTRPLRGFFGPMVVMANERSTSDAEVFPDGFKTLKLGKVVGVTTYGAVIGTGSYTLMDGSTIRTPSVGLWNVNNTNLENYGVPPDVYVDNTPEDFLKGRDAQLEKVVEVLKEEIAKKK